LAEVGSFTHKERGMISRQWGGLAHPNRAKDYVEHLRRETFPALRKIPGFVDASILSRPSGAGIEFVIVTRWSDGDGRQSLERNNLLRSK
jgi:hypothetical protein